jgi:hypothetical protein
MEGLVGYMARIADEVALCETTRKQAESEAIRGNEIDSEVLTDKCSTDRLPSLPGIPRSAEDVSFSQSRSIQERALDSEFSAMNVPVINDRWL